MKWIYFLVFILIFPCAHSQNITAYSDIHDYFYVFDKGINKEIEYLPVQSYKIGWENIIYVANSGALKIYYNGKTYELFQSYTDYFTSKYLTLGELNKQLKVFDNGTMTTLTSSAGSFKMSDSLIAFHDEAKRTFNAYYNGEIVQLEDLLASEDITRYTVGCNIIAYIDHQYYFAIFYHGVVTKLFKLTYKLKYDVGQDIVAYTNTDESSFNVVYQGEINRIEDNIPLSYSAGNGCVAYVDNLGKFKIFKEGQVFTISENQPEFYKVKDDIVVYSEQNYLKVFYKGKSYLLESYIPQSYKYDQSSVAYIDDMGSLKLFQDGKTQTLTYEKVISYDLNGNVLKYVTGNNNCNVFYKGKIY